MDFLIIEFAPSAPITRLASMTSPLSKVSLPKAGFEIDTTVKLGNKELFGRPKIVP